MTGPGQLPRWRAVEIGPGGLPADRIQAVGGDPRPQDRFAGQGHGVGMGPAGVGQWPAGNAGPAAVLGSFDELGRKPSRGVALGWLGLAVAVAVVVAVAAWSHTSEPLDSSAGLQPGTCLSSSAGQAVLVVDCTSPDVEFTVAARYDGSTDSARCAAVSSDMVLVTRDDAVLCLNYRAALGDCLFAGAAGDVGKAPCRTPGSSTTPMGLFRVIAVLTSTVDVRGCPAGTIASLVHVTTREVLCLGLP